MFELSFEEWHAKFAYATPKLQTRQVWREKSQTAWDAIRSSAHYHNGVPCRDVLECPRCTREQTFEEKP